MKHTITDTLPNLLSKAVSATGTEVDALPWSVIQYRHLNELPNAAEELERARDFMVGLEPTDVTLPVSGSELDQNTKNVALYKNDKDGVKTCIQVSKATSRAFGQLVGDCRKNPHAPMPNGTVTVLRYLGAKAAHHAYNDIRDHRARKDENPLVFRYITVKKTNTDGTFTRVPVLRAVCTPTHTLDHGDTRALLEEMNRVNVNTYFADGERNGNVYFMDGAKMKVQWAWDRSQVTVYFPAKTDDEGKTTGGTVVQMTLSETKACSWYITVGVIVNNRLLKFAGMESLNGRHVGTQVADRMVKAILKARSEAEKIRKAAELADKIQVSKEGPLGQTYEALVRTAMGAMANFSIPQAILDMECNSVLDFMLNLTNFETENVEEAERLQAASDTVFKDFVLGAVEKMLAA